MKRQTQCNEKSSQAIRELCITTMLDTIISRTEREKLSRLGISLSAEKLMGNSMFAQKAMGSNLLLYFNPDDKFVREHGYHPNLTLSFFKSRFGSGWEIAYFKFQCAVPKELRGSSYFLVDEHDCDEFCKLLSLQFKRLDCNIEPAQIRKLSLQSFSVAYNILLSERYGKPVNFLKRIGFLDVGKHFRNVMNTEYTEITDGFCDRIYSQNTGHKIYDKGSEIVNQPKTAKEHELCEKIKNQEIPSNIFRLEKTFQKKVPTCNALSGYLGKTVKECCIEDAFNNGFCQSILLDMVEKLGKTFNLIAEDVGHKDNFLSIESALRTAEKLGLKGKNRAFFAVYALSVGQMGVKNTTTMYDDIFGRKGQKERIKYSNMIDELLRKTDLQGFFLVDLFNEVREQVQQFKIYKTEEQARFLFSEIEKRENERPHQFIPSAKPT